jgi:hypothetical protein
MNEKLLWPLITVAREYATAHGEHLHQFDLDMFHNKLAELIVRECLLRIADVRIENSFEPIADDSLVRALVSIREHFGVE